MIKQTNNTPESFARSPQQDQVQTAIEISKSNRMTHNFRVVSQELCNQKRPRNTFEECNNCGLVRCFITEPLENEICNIAYCRSRNSTSVNALYYDDGFCLT